MYKKDILKRRFVELSGSIVLCKDNESLKLSRSVFDKYHIDYLLTNSQSESKDIENLIIKCSFEDSGIRLLNTDISLKSLKNPFESSFIGKSFWILNSENIRVIKILCFNFKKQLYKRFIKRCRTNVLIPQDIYSENTENSKYIIEALSNGAYYFINYLTGVPYNFYAVMTDNEKQSAIFGEEIHLNESMLNFYFHLPLVSDIYLLQDNKIISKLHDKQGCFKISNPGNYQLKIKRYTFNWIITNSITVRL